MALEKRRELGPVTILPDGQMQVRDDVAIYEDGIELLRNHSRRVLEPSEALKATLTGRLRVLADAVWTPEVIKARAAALAAAELPRGGR